MNKREYDCCCHVCKREFTIESEFISCSQWADGRLMLTCNGDPSPDAPQHTATEVRTSWERHMKGNTS